MKDAEAMAVDTLTPSIAQPLRWIETTSSFRCAAATKIASAANARPATWVPSPTWSSRCRMPAVDQATAASAT